MKADRNQIFNWAFRGYVFVIPLSQQLSTKLLLVLFAFGVLGFASKLNIRSLLLQSWEILLYLLVLTAGLLYSTDVTDGLHGLETSFSLLAIPLILAVYGPVTWDKVVDIFRAFAAGLLLASVICLVNATIAWVQTDDIQAFYFYSLTNVIGFSPTYFAYFLIFAITFGMYIIFHDPEENLPANVVITLFFFGVLVLTGGRTSFVSVLFIFSYFIIKFILEPGNSRRKIGVSMVAIMLLSLFVINAASDSASQSDHPNRDSDYWERSMLWSAAIRANDSPLIGVGTGDVSTALNVYYKAHGLDEFARESFNAHNQFIQLYLSNGIFGFLCILILLARPLYLSSLSHFTLGILFLFPFIIYGMTEVFLARYQGVVIFGLIHQLVVSHSFFLRGQKA